MQPSHLHVLPTRVRRNYAGGLLLDQFQHLPNPADGQRPEDWFASTTEARNPGLAPVPQEGLTHVRLPDGNTQFLRDLIQAEPDYMLGAEHRRKWGDSLPFLAKLLDSSMRLHVQAHPTAAFAQQHLASRFGKLETYVVLGVRPGANPYLRLGFQQLPSRDEWRRIIQTQDIPAMDACFTPVPVSVGDAWVVPGGVPHAIGPGLLVLEVMEPTDWVVRCDFEREGIVVPPDARYMGRDLEFCLDIFEYRARNLQQVATDFRLAQGGLPQTAAVPNSTATQLIGPRQTGCFTVNRLPLTTGNGIIPAGNGRIRFCLVENGTLDLACTGAAPDSYRTLESCIIPAGGGNLPCSAHPAPDGTPASLLVIEPG